MRPSGTEPGDFVEFDYDLVEAERRQHIRDVLTHVRPTLEKETGVQLEITNDGNDLAPVSYTHLTLPTKAEV